MEKAQNFDKQYLHKHLLSIGEGLKNGLDFLHEKNVVHNDVAYQDFVLLIEGKGSQISTD